MFWHISFAWNSFWLMHLFQIKNMGQSRIFTAFPRWKTMYRYSHYIVTSSTSCYSCVIKWNITPVTLISDNNKSRILNTLLKVKLLALVEQLIALLKRKFPTHFFFFLISIFIFFLRGGRRRGFPDNCFSEFLIVGGSETLHKKGFLSNTRKALQIRRKQFRVLCRLDLPTKKWIFCRKMPCFRNVTHEFMTARLHRGNLLKKVSTVFGIFICLVSQIIIVLLGLRLSSCLSVTVLKILVKCHKCLKENEFLPKYCSIKNCFEKFNKFQMKEP